MAERPGIVAVQVDRDTTWHGDPCPQGQVFPQGIQ